MCAGSSPGRRTDRVARWKMAALQAGAQQGENRDRVKRPRTHFFRLTRGKHPPNLRDSELKIF